MSVSTHGLGKYCIPNRAGLRLFSLARRYVKLTSNRMPSLKGAHMYQVVGIKNTAFAFLVVTLAIFALINHGNIITLFDQPANLLKALSSASSLAAHRSTWCSACSLKVVRFKVPKPLLDVTEEDMRHACTAAVLQSQWGSASDEVSQCVWSKVSPCTHAHSTITLFL